MTSSALPALCRVLSYAACKSVELQAPAAPQALPFQTMVAVVFSRIAISFPVPPPLTDKVKLLEPGAAAI